MISPEGARRIVRAGAASVRLSPPPGLPMIGFVRRQEPARGEGIPLEASAIALESAGVRIVLCGVDTIGIQSPEVDELRARVSEATGAPIQGVLLNWNHTHCAPPGSTTLVEGGGLLADGVDEALRAHVHALHDAVVAVCAQAAERLEPAALTWGVGTADLSVNRRERGPDGHIVHGWRADGAVDRQVVSLALRRPDGSWIGTLVSFGCHTVSVGMDVDVYSADYPGPLRDEVRRLTGGECVFFQGAGANILPLVSFCDDEQEARRMGRRLALEAVHSLADQEPWPATLEQRSDGSLIPMYLFRFVPLAGEPAVVAAAERRLDLPLAQLPDAARIEELRERYEGELAAARARGADLPELRGIEYHAKWARQTARAIARGDVATHVSGPVCAVRIGEGVIATAPGETFAEIGIAVKQRSPGTPTLYAGYTNGACGYFPVPAAYPEGGYEPVYSNRSYGLPAPAAPECAGMLEDAAVELVATLFPEHAALPRAERPPEPPGYRLEPWARPSAEGFAPPATVTPPG